MNSQQINQLVTALTALTVSGKKKNKRNRKKKGNSSGVQAPRITVTAPNTVVGGKGRRRKRPGPGSSMGDGSLRLRRTVLLTSVTTSSKKSAGGVQLNVRNFSWIKKIAAAYDRVHYNSVAIEFKSAVGTTISGMIAYGFDWSNKTTAPASRGDVQGYSPFRDHAVWVSPGQMRLDSGKLNAFQWYQLDIDSLSSPGYLVWYCDCEKDILVGEIYAHLDVTFTGCVP